jgi:hypothetical protein
MTEWNVRLRLMLRWWAMFWAVVLVVGTASNWNWSNHHGGGNTLVVVAAWIQQPVVDGNLPSLCHRHSRNSVLQLLFVNQPPCPMLHRKFDRRTLFGRIVSARASLLEPMTNATTGRNSHSNNTIDATDITSQQLSIARLESTRTTNATTGTSSVTTSPLSCTETTSCMMTTSSLGDIMNPTVSINNDTAAKGTKLSIGYLASHFGIYHPLDRLALTANGNLQRLLASYYDAPVTVEVEYCTLRSTVPTENTLPDSSVIFEPQGQLDYRPINNTIGSLSTWDRRVHLRVYNQTVCTATSVIHLYSRHGHELVASGQVGLGQLFRYWDILPTFTLHNASRCSNVESDGENDGGSGGGGSFWREYTLSSAAMTCHIYETFAPGLWSLQPPPPSLP